LHAPKQVPVQRLPRRPRSLRSKLERRRDKEPLNAPGYTPPVVARRDDGRRAGVCTQRARVHGCWGSPNLSDGTVAIVVVNGGSAQQLSFFVAGAAWPASVTPYVTTSSSKLAAGSAISVSAGRFSASLAAQSVTTFVGKP